MRLKRAQITKKIEKNNPKNDLDMKQWFKVTFPPKIEIEKKYVHE